MSHVEDLGVSAAYLQHGLFVSRTLARLGVPAADLEDSKHEVFFVLHRRWTDYDPARGSLRNWLGGISRRVAARYFRGLQRRQTLRRALYHLPSTPLPDADLERLTEFERLHRFLKEKLDPPKHEVFMLAELYDCSAKEIAAKTGSNPNTVASRLRAARLRVHACASRMNPQS